MKIRCTQIINEHSQERQKTSPWLTIGKEYVVLAIEMYPTKNLYLIIDDSSNHAPGLHDAKQFEILTHSVPNNWTINPGDLDIMTIGPKVWREDTFWEDCHRGDLKALNIYEREMRIIMEEEGAL